MSPIFCALSPRYLVQLGPGELPARCRGLLCEHFERLIKHLVTTSNTDLFPSAMQITGLELLQQYHRFRASLAVWLRVIFK
jgi:hypothetical protein